MGGCIMYGAELHVINTPTFLYVHEAFKMLTQNSASLWYNHRAQWSNLILN